MAKRYVDKINSPLKVCKNDQGNDYPLFCFINPLDAIEHEPQFKRSKEILLKCWKDKHRSVTQIVNDLTSKNLKSSDDPFSSTKSIKQVKKQILRNL